MEVREGYKKTEIGVIPVDWDMVNIEEVCNISTGGRDTKDKEDDGEFPFFVRSQIIERISSYSYDGEAVLTAGDGVGTGKVFHYINGKFDFHQRVYMMSDFRNIDGYFFFKYFSSNFLKEVSKYTAKSSVDSVRREMISKMKISLPPTLEEQGAIATALSDTDELISSLDKLITKKKNIKLAAMQQLLSGKKRLPGFTGEWEVVTLDEIGMFKNGINKSADDFGFGSPFVNLLDVFGISSISSINNLDLVNSNPVEQKFYSLRRGDVLFVRSSVKPSGVGLTTLVSIDLPKTVFSGFLIRFRDNGHIEESYKKYCFQEEGFRNRLISNSTVSANTNINQEALKRLSLPLPSTIDEQKAIAKILSDIDSEIEALKQKREKYKAIKQGMMQQLLTGKIRLV